MYSFYNEQSRDMIMIGYDSTNLVTLSSYTYHYKRTVNLTGGFAISYEEW